MIEKTRKMLGRKLLKRRLKKKSVEQSNFSRFFKNSSKILLVLPADEANWDLLNQTFDFLLKSEKELSLFLPENRFSSMPHKQKVHSLTYTENDVSKFHLPGRSLSRKLKYHLFDVVIDLNTEENLFYCAVANLVKSNFRIGFVKKNSDLYYNFQIPSEINNEISYRNLLNSLTMF